MFIIDRRNSKILFSQGWSTILCLFRDSKYIKTVSNFVLQYIEICVVSKIGISNNETRSPEVASKTKEAFPIGKWT